MKTALLLPVFFLLLSNSSAQTFTDVKCATWFSPDYGMLIRMIHDREYDVMISMCFVTSSVVEKP